MDNMWGYAYEPKQNRQKELVETHVIHTTKIKLIFDKELSLCFKMGIYNLVKKI